MSYVIAAPEMMATTATDLAAVGSNLSVAHVAAAAPTVAVIPAAADEVSASIAHLFSGYAQGYQALAGQAAVFHEQFVQNLTAGAGSYAAMEAANASSLQPLNAPAATSTSTALSQALAETVSTVQQFLQVNLATLTPQQLLEHVLIILFSPILVPAWFVVEYVVALWAGSFITF